jgi:hypothetical protein
MASRLRLTTFFLAVVIGIPVQAAEVGSSIDLRVVVDMSEAMQIRDPDNLRSEGIEFLIRSLPDQAHAGVWSYARHTQKVAQFGPANALWKQIASIHVDSLKASGDQADLPGALRAASWDIDKKTKGTSHIVLFGNGDIRLGKTTTEDAQARQNLLSTWALGLRRARIVVHTIGFSTDGFSTDGFSTDVKSGDDLDLLRQLAEVSGGLHQVVADRSELQSVLLDVQRRVALQPKPQLDAAGRFQVAPGAQRLTMLWFALDSRESEPKLLAPNGVEFSRLTSLPNGRWLLAQNFEIVTLDEPQPGWWQIIGATPDRLSVFGELDIRIEGVASTVVPTDDSRVEIRLFSQGLQISDADFLDLLDIRAWVVTQGERRPLPVDRQDSEFTAFFVNLDNGAHDLEVQVVAPTFVRSVTVPFVVNNPLRVDIMQQPGEEAIAWVQFSHPEVDYASVRTTGIVRKPPQIAALIPGKRMPGGLWRIPLGFSDGIVEIAFSAAGNYLSGKGVFLKSKPHAVNLPLGTEEKLTLRFDAQGKLINLPVGKHQADAINDAEQISGDFKTANNPAGVAASKAGAMPASTPPEPQLPLLPLWFVALIALLNFAIGGAIWWLNKPKPLPFTPA